MKLRSTKGFSLVELIIVIAIMGIIAVVAIPNLTGIQQRTQVNADIRTAETIARSLATAVAEERDLTATLSLNDHLAAGWYELSTLGTETNFAKIKMSEYVDLELVADSAKNGANDGKYYVTYKRPANQTPRIVVAIAKGGTSETISSTTIDDIPYDGDFKSKDFMIACMNGVELSAGNIALYK